MRAAATGFELAARSAILTLFLPLSVPLACARRRSARAHRRPRARSRRAGGAKDLPLRGAAASRGAGPSSGSPMPVPVAHGALCACLRDTPPTLVPSPHRGRGALWRRIAEHIKCIHVFHHFYVPSRAPGGRRAPSGDVAARSPWPVALPSRRRRDEQKSTEHDTAAEKYMDYDGICMHATANAHGDPQQRSRRRLRPIPHRSAPASPRHGSRRSDGGTRLDDSWRPPEEGRLRGYGQAWVTRAKREVLALKAARTTRSRASRHRHEKEGL